MNWARLPQVGKYVWRWIRTFLNSEAPAFHLIILGTQFPFSNLWGYAFVHPTAQAIDGPRRSRSVPKELILDEALDTNAISRCRIGIDSRSDGQL